MFGWGRIFMYTQYSAAGKNYKIERRETGEETETDRKRESDIGDDIVRSEENVDDWGFKFDTWYTRMVVGKTVPPDG